MLYLWGELYKPSASPLHQNSHPFQNNRHQIAPYCKDSYEDVIPWLKKTNTVKRWETLQEKNISKLEKFLSTVCLSAGLEQVWDVGMLSFSSGWDKEALICTYFGGFILPQRTAASLAIANSEVPQISQVRLTFSITASLSPVLSPPSASSLHPSRSSHSTTFPSHATLTAKTQSL